MTQAQRILNNRYELLAKVGDGGMAVVYKARDIMLNRTVAVKILRESYATDPAFLARFNREAQAAANLNHPNIVNVFDTGQDGDIHYIVMEYIEGSNLKELIVKQAPLPASQAIEIAAQICDAINYAHTKGLIHRDIKPQNILLTNDGTVKVTDFGIAKGYGDQNLTQTGITLGTVHYFSPEQAKGLQVSPQSDIYSIGVVLYEMMTGRIPFESDNPVALAVKHIEELPPPPRRYNPSIPTTLEGIILKALNKDPKDRYPNAASMAKALRNLEGQSAMGTMVNAPAIQPTPRPTPSNRYGNNEIYNQPVQRTPYTTPQPNATRPVNPPNYNNNGGYFGSAADYRDQAIEANLRNLSAPPPTRSATSGYTRNTNYGQGRMMEPPPPPVDEFEERPRTGPGCSSWAVGFVALLVVIALVVGGILILPNVVNNNSLASPTVPAAVSTLNPTKQVAVPNLVNRPQADAQNAIGAATLQVGNVTQQFSDNVAAGNVISQDPAPGQQVDQNTKINLVISKGQDLVQIPDSNNRDANAAATALKSQGFNVQIIQQPDNTIQAGAVIKTDPAGNSKAPRGSTVKLYVSTGKPTPTPAPQPTATPVPAQPTATPVPAQPTATPVAKVDVPDVFNKKQDEAVQTLQQAGFKVDVQSWTLADVEKYYNNDQNAINYFKNAAVGTVVGMNPGPTDSGDKLQQPVGTTITIGVKAG